MLGLTLILSGIATVFLALVALVVLGLYVVRTYPNSSDPARNARRFVIPAAVLLLIAALGVVSLVCGVIFAIFRI